MEQVTLPLVGEWILDLTAWFLHLVTYFTSGFNCCGRNYNNLLYFRQLAINSNCKSVTQWGISQLVGHVRKTWDVPVTKLPQDSAEATSKAMLTLSPHARKINFAFLMQSASRYSRYDVSAISGTICFLWQRRFRFLKDCCEIWQEIALILFHDEKELLLKPCAFGMVYFRGLTIGSRTFTEIDLEY